MKRKQPFFSILYQPPHIHDCTVYTIPGVVVVEVMVGVGEDTVGDTRLAEGEGGV